MSIPRIRNINSIETYQIPNVQNVYIPRWMTTQPNVDYLLPPVVINIGNPTLQRKQGYRQILLIWVQFNLASSLVWKGGDDVYHGNCFQW